MSTILKLTAIAIACAALVALSSCATATAKSATELEVIQNTKGYMTKSLYYVGSSPKYHYFDQFTLMSHDTSDEPSV